MNKNSEFETVLAQFLVDLNTPSATGVTNGVKPRVATELPKISILETRAALPILFISLVYSLPILLCFPSFSAFLFLSVYHLVCLRFLLHLSTG